MKTTVPTVDFELQKEMNLRNNISIVNGPRQEKKNLFAVVAVILGQIGCSEQHEEDIVDAKRIPKSKSNLIVVKFRDESRTVEVMKKRASHQGAIVIEYAYLHQHATDAVLQQSLLSWPNGRGKWAIAFQLRYT